MPEICIKIGNSTGGGYQDGDVISVKPDGVLIPPGGMVAWIRNNVEPPALSTIPQYMADDMRRRISGLQFLLENTAEDIAAGKNISVESAALEKTEALKDQDLFETLGYDSNWGWEDLKLFHVVRVDDVSLADMLEFTSQRRGVDYKAEPISKRGHRVDYENLHDAAMLELIRNQAVRLDVDRQHPVDKAHILSTVTESRHGVA